MSFFKLLVITVLLQTAAWAQSASLEKVTLQLQWKYQFQFAGFIVAQEKGYYKDVGLDVKILEYNNTNTIKELEEGKIDYAINNSLLAFHEGKLNNVMLLATYFQRSPLVIITQPKIESVLDLKGKKVMMSENNRYNSSLSILLDYFNISSQNTTFIKPSFDINDFIERKVDAFTGFRSNELYQLNQKHIPYKIIDPVEHGFSTNAINLFASQEKVARKPQQVKDFLLATRKGWEYALSNINEVARLIHTNYRPDLTVEHLAYEGKVTREMMLTDLYAIGEINKEFMLKTFSQLLRNHRLDANQSREMLWFNQDKKIVSGTETVLTDEEKLWIKNNPYITYTGDPNWRPYEAFDANGNYVGIVSEYLKLIEESAGLLFKPMPVSSWTESLETAMRGDVKVISGDAADAILNKKFNPVQAYSQNPIVIIMRNNQNYVEHLESIADKKIAIIKDYGYTADILRRYPNIDFIEIENIQEGLSGVTEKRFDALLATMALATYTMVDMNLHNLKVVGKTPIVMDLTFFVAKDELMLFNIINKVLSSVSEEQKHEIIQKWIKQDYVERVDYTLVWILALFSVLIIVIMYFWMSRLKQEIDKRIVTEEMLEQSNEKLRGLFELSPLGIVLTDMKGKHIEFNKAFERICGYPLEKLLALDYWELTPEKYSADEARQLESLKKTGFYGPYEKEYRQKDGTLIPISLNGMLITDSSGRKYIWSIVEDISERKSIERELRRQHDFLDAVVNSVGDAIMVFDKDYKLSMMNNAARKMMDKGNIADLMYPKYYELSPHESEVCNSRLPPCSITEAMRTGNNTKAIHTHYDHGGNEKIVELCVTPLKNEEGSVYGIIETVHDITALMHAKQDLQHQAEHDVLTGLPNRQLFLDRLGQSIKHAKRSKKQLAVLFLDLDHFKEVNDSLGHHMGDKLLLLIARHLEQHVRQSDTVARLGGDEFTIIIEDIVSMETVMDLIQNLMQSMSEPKVIDERQLYVTFSIGIAMYPNDADDPNVLLKHADAAMYKAKNEGRHNYQFYTEDMTERAFERMMLETQLRDALQNNELEVHYQIQMDAEKNIHTGMEALIRWIHPQFGMVPPSKFIPLAEDTGFIVKLDEWVMQTAIAQWAEWIAMGLNPGKLSLNLARLQLEHSDFIQKVQDTLNANTMDPISLMFEITEGQMMKNPDEAIKRLNGLKKLGVSLAIDDFGTGYSSLSYLKQLPIDKLKIDRSFVRDIPDDADDIEITRTIIAMAHGLRLEVIAEGVETEEQRDFLIENGCTEVQGFLYHKPASASEIEKSLKEFMQG